MTERLDGTGLHEDAPRIAASSYAADDGLLVELLAGWPPPVSLRDGERCHVSTDHDGSTPAAALPLGDGFAVALVAQPDGGFRVVRVVVISPSYLTPFDDGTSSQSPVGAI